MDVGADILIGLHTCLDSLDVEVIADLLHLRLVAPGGGGHREQQGIPCCGAVVLGNEDVRVVSHRPVALVHDQQDNVGEAVPPGQAVVLDHLRGGKTDPARFPGGGPLVGGGVPGEHDKVGLLRFRAFLEEQELFKKAEVLLNQGFCRRKHEHLPLVRVEAGCCDKERDGSLP